MDVDHLIIARTLDACLTAAMMLAIADHPERVRFSFAPPGSVGGVTLPDPGAKRVVFVGALAGLDIGHDPHVALVELLQALGAAGHKVVGILDTNPSSWREAMRLALGDAPPPRLVGHDLRVYPLRGADPDAEAPFESAAEVLLAQQGEAFAGKTVPAHVALLGRMAVACARGER